MQSATAVQPQPQQAGQGGANYPMASLYVGDLGNIFFIIFSLLFVPSLLTDRVLIHSPVLIFNWVNQKQEVDYFTTTWFFMNCDSYRSYSHKTRINQDFCVENKFLNCFPNLFLANKT